MSTEEVDKLCDEEDMRAEDDLGEIMQYSQKVSGSRDEESPDMAEIDDVAHEIQADERKDQLAREQEELALK